MDQILLFIWITFSFYVVCVHSLHTVKMLICSTFVSNVPLAHSVERGANNCKVLCSRLIGTRLFISITYSF